MQSLKPQDQGKPYYPRKTKLIVHKHLSLNKLKGFMCAQAQKISWNKFN